MSCKLCRVAVALCKKWVAWRDYLDTHAKSRASYTLLESWCHPGAAGYCWMKHTEPYLC